MNKRLTIKKKVRYLILAITLASVLVVSVAALNFMKRIREASEVAVVEEMKAKVSNLVGEKVNNAEIALEKYTNYLDMLVDLIEMIHANPNHYVKQDIPRRSPDSPKEYLTQRSFIDESITVNDVKDELTLLANLESIWLPMMKEDGETIATSYVGTESGFMISFDNNASMAEYSENGEVYFNHRERVWYEHAKEAGKLIFTELSQDYFGRGLSLTCAKPFYYDGKFAGVVAMDILIADLQKSIIDIDVESNYEEDFAFLVNNEGDIIASPFIGKEDTIFENINEPDNKYYEIRKNILGKKTGIDHLGDFYCAYSPIEIADWVLCVYVPEEIILIPVNNLEAAIRSMTNIFIIIFIVAIIIAIVAAGVFAMKLTKPIETLRKDVKEISEGNLDYTARVIGNDEISDLATAFNDMTLSLKNYINDLTSLTAEKERIGAELNVATHIQSSMLPSIFPAFPNDSRFDIYATMDPAKEVGGDFYDFFMIDDKHIAIVVADVSGKGVPAALFMVIGKTLIKDHTSLNSDLSDVFYKVNNLLCESNSENLFITAFEAVINIETGHIIYVNAGHEMPFIYRKGEEWTVHPMKPGFVLAGMENMKFTMGELDLAPGDKIFQYTDGVMEATNSNNELYGMDRLKAALDENCSKNVNELLPAIKADIDKFVGEAPQFDDITMLGFEFKGL